MPKQGFSQDLEMPEYELFYSLQESLRYPKGQFLGLIIRVFAALPEEVQLELVSPSEKISGRAMEKLGQLGTLESAADALGAAAAQQRTQRNRKRARPKSG